MIRLDKFLAMAGGVTRSEAKQLLKKGQVTVNGKTEKSGDTKIDENNDTICILGKSLSYEKYRY